VLKKLLFYPTPLNTFFYPVILCKELSDFGKINSDSVLVNYSPKKTFSEGSCQHSECFWNKNKTN